MSQASLAIPNESGANFRADVNAALQALASMMSGATAPSVTYAYQFWIDTSGGSPILKQRNAANNAWIVIAVTALANFGMIPATGLQNVSGYLNFTNTDYIGLPVGTTAQRPGSPVAGMVRYNTDLVGYEGYNGSVWAPIGGGGFVVTAVQTLTASGTIASSTTDARQLRHVQGTAGATAASTTPFGTGANWKDGSEILLIGNDDVNTVILTNNDAANGLVGNFSTFELSKYARALCTYSSSLGRWILS